MRRALIALVLIGCGDSDPSSDTTTTTTAPTTTSTPDVIDDVIDDEVTPEPPAWRHEGPITTSTVAAPSEPFFVERLDALGGAVLPEGRAMIVDIDGDGLDDIVVLGTTPPAGTKNLPVVLRNTGDFTFENVSSTSGIAEAEAVLLVFGDLDNDGDQDAFAGTSFRSPEGLHGTWLNDGKGRFTYVGDQGLQSNFVGAGSSVYKEMSAATLADFDKDGVLDLYLGVFRSGSIDGNVFLPPGNELYHGLGDGHFDGDTLPAQNNPLTGEVNPSEAQAKRATYGVCPADFDDDGDMDVFVNNYGAGRPELDDPPHYWEWNFLWRNDGAMTFVDVGVASQVHATLRGIGGVEQETPVKIGAKTYPSPIGGNGFACDWGDFDNDGDLDLVVGQIAHPDYPQTDRTMLHVNPGGAPGSPRVFSEESAARGLQYYEDELFPVWVDIDHDGRLDLAVSRLRGGSKEEMYLQTDAKTFAMQTYGATGVDIATPGPTVWSDFDHDGDLDFFMPKSAGGRLFENVAAHGHWLALRLVGQAGKSPRDATGARITLAAGPNGVGPQMREITSGNGHYNNQNTREVIFGLGGDSGAAALTIRWPDGEVQVVGDVKANVRLRIEQGGAITAL